MIATRNQDNKKHGGRPTVADGKRLSKAVTVKFSKKDYELLKVRSKKANKRMAEYVRESALQSEVVQPRTEAYMKEFRTLVGLANNLNQLTKMAHQDGIIYLYSPIGNLLEEITNTIRGYKQENYKKKK
ncbi:MAG: mobilization protein [Prevotella sp.]|nr:mobilization protein [Prevotella sp.]